MSTQQPPRPWFRFAPIMRPPAAAPAPAPAPAPVPAPTPAAQPPPPISPFRPPVVLARPPPPAVASPPPSAAATAPPSPVAPPPLSLPIVVSPTSATPTTPKSPQITGASPPPKSPVPTPAASVTKSPIVSTPAPPPPPAIPKPESTIVKNSSSSPPASLVQKATTETSATRPAVSPAPKTKTSAPSSPLPASPATKTILSSQAPKAVASPVAPPPSPLPTVAPPATVRAQSASSPKMVKTPPPQESPIRKTLSHPPSPLMLPPPQLKADTDHLEPIPAVVEQKTVVTQESTTDQEKLAKATLKMNNHGEIHNDRGFTQNGEKNLLKKDKGKMTYKKKSDTSPDQSGIRVVTLAGENKGAVMEFSPAAASRKKYNLGQRLGSSINGEGKQNTKDENDARMQSKPPTDAFVNSNVQGVNNSILYNCTHKNRDPGVHLSVSRMGNGFRGGLHVEDSGHRD
ncbi:hypothetical protein ACH5RR_000037 [Cinchona calisaya]|uniref:Vegetative cell wall protein gp1-like n=1 Tax=Cinchona calisaya TaxID=153742 RepID=A0ABD3AZQ3_9GENT